MPRITPTQFYNTTPSNAMTLRSGKKINYQGSTDFVKETLAMMKVIDVYTRIIDYDYDYDEYHYDRGVIIEQEFSNIGVVVVPDYISKIIEKQHCVRCSKLLVFNAFVCKWRKTINTDYSNIDFRNALNLKINDAVERLKKLETDGEYHLCGCSNPTRRDKEDKEWNVYLQNGKQPGYSHEVIIIGEEDVRGYEDYDTVTEWINTPDITQEEYEEEMI
ncbi:MAG: hypothetical protein WD512_08485, partial [Candidatus Paceibacterota bacterium]